MTKGRAKTMHSDPEGAVSNFRTVDLAQYASSLFEIIVKCIKLVLIDLKFRDVGPLRPKE